MKLYLTLLLLLVTITTPCGAGELVDNQSAAAADKETQQKTEIEDFESGYIDDFELADVPPTPQTTFDISGFQEDEYSRGRMAFLFGQYEVAYKIWRPLADHGYAKAQATLGWMYHTGKGVTKDLSAAYDWYEKAAQQNHAVAQNNLGVFYEQGLFVGKSATKAAKWYREAAEWGYPFAQYNLGTLYLEGRGVKKDEKEAQFWLQIAALQGVEQAVQTLQKMSVAMHGGRTGNASVISSQGPNWSKNSGSSASSGKDKSPHNTPHGSSRYKNIYNRIKSSDQTGLGGTNYGRSPSLNAVDPTIRDDAPVAKSTKDQNKGNQSLTSEKKQPPITSSTTTVKPATDELLPGEKFDQWLAEAQLAQKRLKEFELEKKTNSHSLKIYNDEWVKEQNPAYYTLQLARSDKLDWLLDVAKKQPMLKDTAYYTALIDGKKWYYLIYGNFENQKSASAEINKLPKALKQWSPWVRQFSEVQSKIHVELAQ